MRVCPRRKAGSSMPSPNFACGSVPVGNNTMKIYPCPPVCERKLSFGSCSARLQAGICLVPKCPPEGGRYKTVPVLSSHTDSKAGHFLLLDVAAEPATPKD